MSQLDNSSLLFNTRVDTSREQSLYVKIQNFNYMKDNEYTNVMMDGFTLFGYQFNPQLGYQISKNLSIEGGIFLNKDFGNTNFTQVAPTFSLRYYKKDFKMIFGNIDGSLNHQLIEPIYNFERVVTSRLESGAQFQIDKKYFDVDVWVNWLNAIYKNTNQKEKILGGINWNIIKLNSGNFDFKLPLQGLLIHEGGQYDTSSIGAFTDYNFAVGTILKYKTHSKIIQSVYLDTRYVLRANNYYNSPIEIHTKGDGLYANVGLECAYNTNIMLSYWNGNDYYNEFGGDLYSSKSRNVKYGYYSERLRELLILRITKKVHLANNINLTLRFEPYYDMRNKFFESSFGFYVTIDEKLWFKNKVQTANSD